MHVLFAWRRPPAPAFIGGAEISQRLLAEALVREGHRVSYIGGHEHSRTGEPELPRLLRGLRHLGVHPEHDGANGYDYQWRGVSCTALPQHRIKAAINHIIETDPPDAVITSQEGASELLSLVPAHITTIGWLHSVSRVGLDVLSARPDVALATSRFVAQRCKPHPTTRLVTFYPPFAEPNLAVTRDTPSMHDELLMINPVPDKGGQLVFQLAAATPERPFTVVEGWWPIKERPSRANLTYLPPQWSTEHLYQRARLLLMPSTVEEAFARVVIEAGLHGVPTIGSNRGALPETIADGGITLDPTDWHAWRDTIRDLDEPDTYERYSRAARENAQKYLRPVVHELTAADVLTVAA